MMGVAGDAFGSSGDGSGSELHHQRDPSSWIGSGVGVVEAAETERGRCDAVAMVA